MKSEVKRGPWGKVIAGLLSLVVAVATLSAWPSTGAIFVPQKSMLNVAKKPKAGCLL